MSDLISRSNLLKELEYYILHTPEDSRQHYAYNRCKELVKRAPTIEAKEEVHSRWELIAWHKGIKVCKCLNCNKTQLGNTPLCGHCGADMRRGGAE